MISNHQHRPHSAPFESVLQATCFGSVTAAWAAVSTRRVESRAIEDLLKATTPAKLLPSCRSNNHPIQESLNYLSTPALLEALSADHHFMYVFLCCGQVASTFLLLPEEVTSAAGCYVFLPLRKRDK